VRTAASGSVPPIGCFGSRNLLIVRWQPTHTGNDNSSADASETPSARRYATHGSGSVIVVSAANPHAEHRSPIHDIKTGCQQECIATSRRRTSSTDTGLFHHWNRLESSGSKREATRHNGRSEILRTASKLSRGLPFYASDEAGVLYAPLTFSVPGYPSSSTASRLPMSTPSSSALVLQTPVHSSVCSAVQIAALRSSRNPARCPARSNAIG
jgi:hypothetical protein